MAVDPRELKTARLRKGLDIFYVADRINLDPMTLRGVEEEELRADDGLLDEWARIIIYAPSPKPWYLVAADNPWTVAAVASFVLALGFLAATLAW